MRPTLLARVSDPALAWTEGLHATHVVGRGSPDPARCKTEGLHATYPSLDD